MKLSKGFPKKGLMKAIRHRASIPLLQVRILPGRGFLGHALTCVLFFQFSFDARRVLEICLISRDPAQACCSLRRRAFFTVVADVPQN